MSEVTIEQAMRLALGHHQAGRLREADDVYRKILAAQPKNADALHLLGVIAGQAGRHEEAARLIREAIAAAPGNPEYYCNLGTFLQNQGQLDEAIECFQRALALKPDLSEVNYNLGNAWKIKGQLDQAVSCYQREVALKPDHFQSHNNLGAALADLDRLDQAIASYRRAMELKPDNPQTYNNLGNTLTKKGELDQAIFCYQRALALKGDDHEIHFNLANAWQDKGQLDQAIACYQRAVGLKPDYIDAFNNLGIALANEGRLDQAVVCYQRMLAVRPDHADGHYNLGKTLAQSGQIDRAISHYQKALALKPDYVKAHCNLLYTLLFLPVSDPHRLFVESEQWDREHAQPLRQFIQPHANDRNPERRLRIGYVSPDFRDHPVGRFMASLLTAHDRRAFEIFCYAQVPRPGEITAKLRGLADNWRSTVGLSDEQVADMIRQDGIDILVDLAGHTADNRLLVFARKPAPVQINYMGYPATTGLSAMDYRFTDALVDPPDVTDGFHSEQLIRLPRSTWCCPEFENAPAVGGLPALEAGRVTFGSFNNLAKVNEPLLKLWAKVLNSTGSSRLLLKAKGLSSESVQRQVCRVMGEAGIEPDRIELCPWVPAADHLARYGHVDIALDTYPYHGTTTTCEALWMGVPVVSLAGDGHVSRAGVSLLTNVGLPELVAQSSEEFVRVATELAGDLPRLAELRATLRERMRNSPLMDARRFARDVEEAYRTVWREWCEEF
jgi:protein O-GlcNAc transferase